MLLVILGAGASYDSDPDRPAHALPEYGDRPPVTSDLFSLRFGHIFQMHADCQSLVMELRNIPSNVSMEEAIEQRLHHLTRRDLGGMLDRDTKNDVPKDEAPEPSQFENFEKLTRRLVRVPKTELDEKRREAPSARPLA